MHSGVQAKADKSPVTVADYGTCWNLCLVLNLDAFELHPQANSLQTPKLMNKFCAIHSCTGWLPLGYGIEVCCIIYISCGR